jgi:hypothetical protein
MIDFDFDAMMKRPLPRSAPEGKTLILVLPDGSIRPVPSPWLGTDADEFEGLRAAEREAGGMLVYVPEMQVEGVPLWKLPTYRDGHLIPADPNSSLAQAEWKRLAQEELNRTDYVPAKAMESGRTLSRDWAAWREELRATIRGERKGMPRAEPERWGGTFEPQGEPEAVEMPEFLKGPTPEVMDVLAEAGVSPLDSYERVNETLIRLLTEAKGSAELARGYGGMFAGKSVVEWERKAQSINESIRWNAGRRVETI